MAFLYLNTEGHHEWEVPADITEASFALWSGSNFYSSYGGTISDLVPGETLHFNLGGNAINSGWNGGGASAGAVAGGFALAAQKPPGVPGLGQSAPGLGCVGLLAG
jgi:hypothetical protein